MQLKKLFKLKLSVLALFIATSPVIFERSTFADESVVSVNPQPIRVLTIDGGGVRGVIPAKLLSQIEKLTGRSISSQFDLIAGTSTGGILALGLSVADSRGEPKFLAQDLLDLYLTKSEKFFSSSLGYRIKNAWGLMGPKYPASGIESELETYFGDARLKDALVHVLVTGHQLGGSGIEFFSADAKSDPFSKDALMREVARATSAAPTYFSPTNVTLGSGQVKGVVDGGLYKNNPAMLAYVKAREMFPGRRIEIYSLGTGKLRSVDDAESAAQRGMIGWVSPVISTLMRNSSVADMQMLRLAMNCKTQCIFRVNPYIDFENEALDNTQPENLKALLRVAEKETKSAEFRRFVDALVANPT